MDKLSVAFSDQDSWLRDTSKSDWLILYTQHRDSDILTRSNWEVLVEDLGEGCETMSASHWAVGWVEYLLINPDDSEAVRRAEDWECVLADYPVCDDEHYSNMETKEADEFWASSYNEYERIEYIRMWRNQFEFHDMANLMSCVRGEYFAGYASELLC